MLFLLWFYFDVLLPKRLNFGDFDAPAPEVVAEHYVLWDWETSHFLQAIRVSSVLYFYFLYSPFLWVSLHFSLRKHWDKGRCLINCHQQGYNNDNNNNINNNNNNNKSDSKNSNNKK